jgi:hypothetical protein
VGAFLAAIDRSSVHKVQDVTRKNKIHAKPSYLPVEALEPSAATHQAKKTKAPFPASENAFCDSHRLSYPCRLFSAKPLVRLSVTISFLVQRSLAPQKTASSPWPSSDQGEGNFLFFHKI